jgi:hypothetical protein
MSMERFPVGQEIDVTFPNLRVSKTFLSAEELKFEIKEGPFARIEIVAIRVVPLGNSLFAISWQEKGGATVTNIQDYDRGLVQSYATLPGGQFLQMSGTLIVVTASKVVADDKPSRNKALVLEAMTALFQLHDASGVERLYAPNYIQHNPNIPQGRDALIRGWWSICLPSAGNTASPTIESRIVVSCSSLIFFLTSSASRADVESSVGTTSPSPRAAFRI